MIRHISKMKTLNKRAVQLTMPTTAQIGPRQGMIELKWMRSIAKESKKFKTTRLTSQKRAPQLQKNVIELFIRVLIVIF